MLQNNCCPNIMCSLSSVIYYCIPLINKCTYRILKVIWFMLRFPLTANHKLKWWRLTQLWCFSVNKLLATSHGRFECPKQYILHYLRSHHKHFRSQLFGKCLIDVTSFSPTVTLHYAPEFSEHSNQWLTSYTPSLPRQRAKSCPSWKWS
jgi:hypothetical protein